MSQGVIIWRRVLTSSRRVVIQSFTVCSLSHPSSHSWSEFLMWINMQGTKHEEVYAFLISLSKIQVQLHASFHRFTNSVRFFMNIFLMKKPFQLKSHQYPVWMTQKRRKSDFRELTFNKISWGYCLRTPLHVWACAFGACLRGQSVFILHVWN